MYAIINPDTNAVLEFPILNIRAKYPRTSFPRNPTKDNLPPEVAIVEVPAPPVTSLLEKTEMSTPVYDAVFGTWSVSYNVVPKTAEEVAATMDSVIKVVYADAGVMLDNFARERGYDTIVSLCNYSTSADPVFQADAAQGIATRDATWVALRNFNADVAAGTVAMPSTLEDILAVIPPMVWA